MDTPALPTGMLTAPAVPGTRGFQLREAAHDLVVIGGGPAGFCAAITAARLGLNTALVHDRSVLGGNHGPEIRVGISGAGHRPWGRYSIETGVIEEFLLTLAHRRGIEEWCKADLVYFEMAAAEPRLTLYLNTLVDTVRRHADGRLAAVSGPQQRSETRWTLTAPWFMDCTGDGTVGHLAGAAWRLGSEAQAEFGEPSAPPTANRITMGATLYFYTRDVGKPVPFVPPAGSLDLKAWPPEQFPYFGQCFGRAPDGTFSGYWWAEIGGLIDPIADDAAVTREARQLVYGIWDYIKNSGRFAKVETLELHAINVLPGKRESRRLVGPVTLTEVTFKRQERFPDAVAYAGYMLDVHPAFGYRTPDWRCAHNYHPGPGDVPLRALYTDAVPNLFMAGRCISASRIALGTLRVAATSAVTGQGAATAVAWCHRHGCLPRELTPANLADLQRLLLRQDNSLLGRTLLDPADLSRQARVCASSARRTALTETETGDAPTAWLPLDQRRGLLLPVPADRRIETLSLRIRAAEPAALTLDLFGSTRPENYRLEQPLGNVTVTAPAGESWVTWPLAATPGAGLKLFALLRPAAGVELCATDLAFTGILGIEVPAAAELGAENEFKWRGPVPWFRTTPELDLYAATAVQDGHIRPYALPHLWSSAPMTGDAAPWLEWRWDVPRPVAQAELVFNSDLNHPDVMFAPSPWPTLVRAYRLEAETDGRWSVLAEERDNYRRFRRHTFAPVTVSALRLVVEATWGHPCAELFDGRFYATPDVP